MRPRSSGSSPLNLTVIIPVFERPLQLHACLSALGAQHDPPPFDIVVVDDGSRHPLQRDGLPGDGLLTLRMVRQSHAGIAAARNRGIDEATGDLLVFLDSDVVPTPMFLRALAVGAAGWPTAVAFQARLVAHPTRMSWRVEGARLAAIQNILSLGDGRIRYANTSAFAVRRRHAQACAPYFDPTVRRGEDTLILARLARQACLPTFVPDAVAEHRPPGQLPHYLIRHLRIGYQDVPARIQASAAGHLLLTPAGRIQILRQLAHYAGPGLAGRLVLVLALLGYAFELAGRMAGHAKQAIGALRQPANLS